MTIEHNCLQYYIYIIGRLLTAFVLGPLLIYLGTKYEDDFILIIGILAILWDIIKLIWSYRTDKTCTIHLSKLQNNLYLMGRLLAVFIVGPVLIYLGTKYDDAWLITLGSFFIAWDGIKLICPKWYTFIPNA